MKSPEPIENRIEPEPNTGCWLWTGCRHMPGGYGIIKRGHRYHRVHRYLYELYRGPIEEGLHCDHLCRNRACVNPWHIEIVTMRENILRGTSPTAINAKKSTCSRGHELPEGEWVPAGRREQSKWTYARECRLCRNRLAAESYWRTRPARLESMRRSRQKRRAAREANP